jgi:hypothetical protein
VSFTSKIDFEIVFLVARDDLLVKNTPAPNAIPVAIASNQRGWSNYKRPITNPTVVANAATNYSESHKALLIFGVDMCSSKSWASSTGYPNWSGRFKLLEHPVRIVVHSTACQSGNVPCPALGFLFALLLGSCET